MPSLLATDAYKFSMAEAGFPLREETFYYSHRKGGWAYLPFDPKEEVKKLRPEMFQSNLDYLDTHGYALSAASRQALAGQVRVSSIPKGSWFFEREPVFSVTGPSALVSWLEPQVLQLQFRIQLATEWLLRGRLLNVATCEQEREIIASYYNTIEMPPPPLVVGNDDYFDAVYKRAKRMVGIVRDPARLFEVGMRAVTCQQQHEIAMSALASAGIRRTSNVETAAKQGLDPVGTMGHEHIQRFGSSLRAFQAMRDRVPGFISYLPDTFSTLNEGVPAALRALGEAPLRASGIRFDSEKHARSHYIATICRIRDEGLPNPRLLLESGWNEEKTVEFEQLREAMNWPAELQGYGIGGYFVKPPWSSFARDDVAAVYKLSWSGRPCRKTGDEPDGGKVSLPGRPVLWRGTLGAAGYNGPVGWVAQEGEDWRPPLPAYMLTDQQALGGWAFTVAEVHGFAKRRYQPLAMSPETLRMIEQCGRERAQAFAEACGG